MNERQGGIGGNLPSKKDGLTYRATFFFLYLISGELIFSFVLYSIEVAVGSYCDQTLEKAPASVPQIPFMPRRAKTKEAK